jgi:hypothetical protein
MKAIYYFLSLIFLLGSCSAPSSSADNPEQNSGVDNGKEIVCFVYHRFGDSRYPSTSPE